MRRRAAALLALALPLAVEGEVVTRRVGQLTVEADTTFAQPGGVLVVRLRPAQWLGAFQPIFEGRRAPVYASARGPRALVPIPATSAAGPGLLGIEVAARSGAQRVLVDFPIAPRAFPERVVAVPEEKRALLQGPAALRDGRRLMVAVRTLTAEAAWRGGFRPPTVVPPVESYGARMSYTGFRDVETMLDGMLAEVHRGLDYPAAVGSLVQAPAGGTVVMATTLALSGQTVVVDHGQGLVSAFFHLSRIDVREGDRVEGRAALGLSGESGIAAAPHLHWGVYLHGIAVDPQVILALLQ